MAWVRRLWLRFESLFRRGRNAQRLDAEIQFHREQQIVENLAVGMSPDDARRAALRVFGNPTVLKEETRDTWGWTWLAQWTRDVRHSWRTLSRARGFTLVTIVVMALGIGANTAIFTVVRCVLLQPLPFKDPDRLVMLYERSPDGKHPINPVAGGIFQQWQKQTSSFEQMALWGGSGYILSGAGGQLPEQLEGTKCSWNLFPTLGVQPAYGRGFSESDDRPDARATIVLSWSLWTRRFGGDPSILGKDIFLDDQPWTVVGIMPAWFSYPSSVTQVWTPIRHETRPEVIDSLTNHQFRVVARLRPGANMAQGPSEADTIEKRLAAEHPHSLIGQGANSLSLLDEVVAGYKSPLYVLMAAIACFFLIACLNLANLFVARSTARRKELALRSALGGGRWRLVQEQMAESLLLALSGGLLGVMVSYAAVQWLIRRRQDMPRVHGIHIDVLVLCFAAGITLLSASGAGLWPTLGATSNRLLGALQQATRSSGSTDKARLRKILLSMEVGLTVVLLVAAGLLLKSYQRLRSSNLGCATENILTLRLNLPKPRYAEAQRRAPFLERVMGGVRSLPGVQAAGMVTSVPGQGYFSDDLFRIVEHPPLPFDQGEIAIKHGADVGYFAAMQIPLLRGRTFNDAERLGRATSVVISELFRRKFFPGEDPLGKHLRVNLSNRETAYEIVGTVGDTRFVINRPAEPIMYFPMSSGVFGRVTIVVRSTQDPSALALPIQKLIARMDPDLPVADVLTMEQLIGRATINAGFNANLVLAFAVLSLLLASVGFYGVLSYLVMQRTAEIGIRVALGAQRREVLRLVLVDGLRPASVGLGLGLAGGLAAAKMMRNLLYGVQPLDATVFTAGALVLLTVAAGACLLPAWRASRLDPMQALRNE
jgi:putative ABC transport system permease protein